MDGLFDHIPTGLLLLDDEARICRANPAARALLGGGPSGEVGWPSDLRPRASLIARAAVRVNRTGQSSALDLSVGGEAAGRVLHLVMNPAPTATHQGSGPAPIVVASLVDVTAERQAVGAELEAHTLLRQVLELHRDPVLAVGAGDQIVESNLAAEALLARPADAIVGTPLGHWLEPVRATALLRAAEIDAGARLARSAVERADAMGPALSAAAITVRRAGQPVTLVRLEAPVEAASIAADRPQARLARLGRMSAAIAHDLNNLLTVVGLTATALADEPGGDDELLSELLRAYRRAQALVGQLLDLARPAAPEPVRMSVDRLIDDALAIAGPRVGDAVRVQIANDVDRPVIVEREQCVRALTNLVVNAADALSAQGAGRAAPAARGIISIASRIVERPADAPPDVTHRGRFLELTVTDDGPGMPPEVAARVFEPLFTTKSADRGTGLGLAIVADCAQQHDGWVRLDTAPGRGAAFSLYLPDVERPARVLSDSRARSVMPSDRRGLVLVAEPDPAVARSITTTLERRGYQVSSTTSAAEALGLLDVWLADGVVLAATMQLDGQPLWARIRQRWPTVPLVLCGDPLRRPSRGGSIVVLRKPFAAAALDAALDGLLRRRGSAVSGSPSQC